MKVNKQARFRLYEDAGNPTISDRINQLVIDNFFHHKPRLLDGDRDNDYSEHYIYRMHNRGKCNPLTKMEYDYFYYLYTNYYKMGAPKAWGLVEPVPPS